jgi:3-deoxy-D-manno-octulosonate 8-phosphate phosphatase (KDO 8-P phosphatase)
VSGPLEIEARFSKLGGVFITPADELATRLEAIRGLVCDWDGVFNAGAKGHDTASTFAEADSMGLNLLRYALWRKQAETQPVTALITGVDNPTAREFAAREHLHAVFSGAKNKALAVQALCARHRLSPDQLVCFFDDVNDLGMAFGCGVRVLVRRDASPLLQDYVARYGLCDYITAHPAHAYAMREAAELLLGLLGSFDAVVAARVAWGDEYVRFFTQRQAVATDYVDQTPAP